MIAPLLVVGMRWLDAVESPHSEMGKRALVSQMEGAHAKQNRMNFGGRLLGLRCPDGLPHALAAVPPTLLLRYVVDTIPRIAQAGVQRR
jgi:hypothetical protein